MTLILNRLIFYYPVYFFSSCFCQAVECMFYCSHVCVSQNETACKGLWSSVGYSRCRNTSSNGNQVQRSLSSFQWNLTCTASLLKKPPCLTAVSDKVKWRWCTFPQTRNPTKDKRHWNQCFRANSWTDQKWIRARFCGQPQKLPKVKGRAELIDNRRGAVWIHEKCTTEMGNICSDSLLLQAFTKRLYCRCETEE